MLNAIAKIKTLAGTVTKVILPLAHRALLSSGSLNDGKAAIPLLKGLKTQFPEYSFSYTTMDAGYDYEGIYQEVRKANAHAIMPTTASVNRS